VARILLVQPGPDFSVADVYRGWYKALTALGHTVMEYNTSDRLTFYGRARMPEHDKPACEHCGQVPTRQAVPDSDGILTLGMDGLYAVLNKFWPDIVFFVSGFYLTPAMLQFIRTRRHKVVILHTESPYQDDEQLQRGQFADLNLLNDPVNIQAWRDLDVPVAYMPHAYDPDVHYPADPRSYEADFTFIGTAFRSRQEFFHRMDLEGLAVAFGGNWANTEPEYQHLLKYLGHAIEACVSNEETARIYRLSRVGINFYRRESEDAHAGEGWAMGPREVEMAACGLFFLRDPRPESDEMFGGVLPVFSSPEEASELLRYWVQNDGLREDKARQARERIEDRTFLNHAKKALTLMEEAAIL
jgi:spore maturation protein CgeB